LLVKGFIGVQDILQTLYSTAINIQIVFGRCTSQV